MGDVDEDNSWSAIFDELTESPVFLVLLVLMCAVAGAAGETWLAAKTGPWVALVVATVAGLWFTRACFDELESYVGMAFGLGFAACFATYGWPVAFAAPGALTGLMASGLVVKSMARPKPGDADRNGRKPRER